eukprot:m.23572 g.23572  ORF g.23572 m.23572 type:complete len:566 (+) comp8538_c0_seq1:82-1779(+)
MAADLTTRLKVATAEKFARFEAARHGSGLPFWDVILLTASDESQATAYTEQITAKLARKELPPCRYHVIADPPGPKVGNGGATFVALEWLENTYGAQLDAFKVLLLHAGGFSKRLPNVSVVGKIFAVLPLGEPVYSMLEIKLATYIDFPANMSPGVFLGGSDDIELFESDEKLAFHHPGFTALAHPSSIEIGTTHGVFVLDDPARVAADQSAPCLVASCLRFLHKPSATLMHAAAAVVPGTQTVYTDSAYYFDRATAKVLLSFYSTHKPLTCEVDSYGDFLQALGPNATDEYTNNGANVVKVEASLAETRLALFHHLKGTPLHVVACNISKFYHIGTLPEFLFHYCEDEHFAVEMGLVRHAGSVCALPPGPYCVINSTLHASVTVGPRTVVEFATAAAGVRIGAGCLVSGVALPDGAIVPDNTFLHTAAVADGFVAVLFGIADDLKKARPASKRGDHRYLGHSLRRVLALLGRSEADAFPEEPSSLWDTAMFPALATAAAAATWALTLAHAVAALGPDSSEGDVAVVEALAKPVGVGRWYSMASIIEHKDIRATIALQQQAITKH